VVSSKATTPEAYIAELPPERADLIRRVRNLVNAHLPEGYREAMAFGMIGWGVPLARYPNTYNGQPLGYAALASQKNYAALYLNCVYASEDRAEKLRAAYAKAGKKLDMGKSCIRFKNIEDLAENALAEAIASTPVDRFIAEYEAVKLKPS
jgi:hypothetical protein